MLFKISCTLYPLCTLILQLCLRRLCHCGLLVVLWWHISIITPLLVAEPRRTVGLLFASQCLCGTILPTMYSMVWDWQDLRSGPMLFYWPKLAPLLSSAVISFTSFFLCIFIVGPGSSDWLGDNRSLPALHCRPFIILKIITTKVIIIGVGSNDCLPNKIKQNWSICSPKSGIL